VDASFRNDVGVETVAKVDGVNVVTKFGVSSNPAPTSIDERKDQDIF
jgi:hypothetical protein